jgi:pimeloyl-ACP methyl ester carboxylesterase
MQGSELSIHQHLVDIEGATIEVHEAAGPESGPVVCAAHPADAYLPGTATLLRRLTGARVLCINPRGLGASSPGNAESLLDMVRDIEQVRQRLGVARWTFWGISGGGWLAQLYARDFPESVQALVLESNCASFCARLADPACLMSPLYPAWRELLLRANVGNLDGDPGERAPSAKHSHPPTGETCWVKLESLGYVLLDDQKVARVVVPRGLPVSERMLRAQPAFLQFDSRPWLTNLNVRVLTVAGTDDPIAPLAHCRALHDGLQRSVFVQAEGASHTPILQGDEPSRAALRDFLASSAQPTPAG